MKERQLTVYIVTYNRKYYLQQCLQSVINQTFTEFNLVVLDNCSTDGTEDVVKSFHDSRIMYVRHNKNIGGIGNINFALKTCSTPFCVIFHDDDIMEPSFLEREITIIRQNDMVAMVSTNAWIIDENGVRQHVMQNRNEDKCYSDGQMIENYLFFKEDERILIFPSIMYRMSAIKELKLEIEKEAGPGGDVVFYNSLMLHGWNAYVISDPLINYRIHSNQDSSKSYYVIDLQMFDYMSKHQPFESILGKYSTARRKIFKNNANSILAGVIRQRLTANEGRELVHDYASCLHAPKSRGYTFLILIAIWMTEHIPMVMFFLYKNYKRVQG